MNRISHWIDGKAWSGAAERAGDVYDPATGQVSGHVDFAGPAEVDAAVGAARGALPGWRDTSLSRRTNILFGLVHLVVFAVFVFLVFVP